MSNEALKALIEKVEAGSCESPAKAFHLAMGGKEYEWDSQTKGALELARAYSGSVDAAISFLSIVLPDHHWLVEKSTYNSKFEAWVRGDTAPGQSVLEQDCPARALLLATLRAMQEE